MKKKKMLAVLGSVWDFWPLLLMFEEKYDKPKYISFYKPWLKGRIQKNRIIEFNEKTSNILLWPFKILSRTIKITRTVLKENPDIVNSQHDDANTAMVPVIFIVKKLMRRKDINFYFWIRNNPLETHNTGFYSSYVRFLYRFGYGMADKIFMQCEENRDIFIEKYPHLKSKIVLFQNVYEISENLRMGKEPLPDNAENIFSNGFVFINIGRLTEQKGQWYLIRAFSKIAQKEPHAKLVIIGDGELKPQLEKLARDCGVEDKVFLIGHQNNVFRFLKRSGCFVFPSLWEGFGNVIVESLSMNTPVISSDCIAGPRRILCPELKYTQKIKYPYQGKYGILAGKFKREMNWNSVDKSPLNAMEKNLHDCMLLAISGKLDKYHSGIERASEFDKKNTLKKFGHLLD